MDVKQYCAKHSIEFTKTNVKLVKTLFAYQFVINAVNRDDLNGIFNSINFGELIKEGATISFFHLLAIMAKYMGPKLHMWCKFYVRVILNEEDIYKVNLTNTQIDTMFFG